MLREEFRLLKLILHSELRRRAASRRALPCPSSVSLKYYVLLWQLLAHAILFLLSRRILHKKILFLFLYCMWQINDDDDDDTSVMCVKLGIRPNYV